MADENPILNNPYEEPNWHYATNLQGELDYSCPVKGRRIFTPEVQTIPVRQGAQGDLMELNEVAAADHGSHIVNLLRREVSAWRQAKYPQTTRITRELLQFWFLNPERDSTQSLFFAQREAIETAIWLNEIAEKSNVGQHVLRQLEEARKVSASPENNPPRIAFKMATGSGKTVVMGELIAYHYFNRAEYRNDVRFADNFLLIAPGITIRDRLSVLRVDTRLKNAFLDFHIPYTDIVGEQREYFPDFIVRCRNGEPLHLVLEISGMRKDKALKKWTVENRWLPAVNRIREQHGWDKWDFLEIANEVELADLRNILIKRLKHPPTSKLSSLVWAGRENYVAAHGEITDDFELPARKVESDRWGKNPIEGLTMPVTHLLDTSVDSQPISKQPHPEVMQRWQALGDTALVTSAICEAEMLFGIRKKGSTKLATGYETILKGRYDALPVDSAVAAAYAELWVNCESRGAPVPDMDLLIAATAKANNLIVATLNTNDFHAIQGITVEDWS